MGFSIHAARHAPPQLQHRQGLQQTRRGAERAIGISLICRPLDETWTARLLSDRRRSSAPSQGATGIVSPAIGAPCVLQKTLEGGGIHGQLGCLPKPVQADLIKRDPVRTMYSVPIASEFRWPRLSSTHPFRSPLTSRCYAIICTAQVTGSLFPSKMVKNEILQRLGTPLPRARRARRAQHISSTRNTYLV